MLLLGLIVVQTMGLLIHTLDRIDFARINNAREVGAEVGSIYRAVAEADPLARDADLRRLHLPPGFHAFIADTPILGSLHPAPFAVQGFMRHNVAAYPIPPRLRPTRILIANNYNNTHNAGFFGPNTHPGEENAWPVWHPFRPGEPPPNWLNGGPPRGEEFGPMGEPHDSPFAHLGRLYAVSMQFPDDQRWLTVRFVMPLADPFLSPTLPLAFLLMTTAAGLLSIWAVRRLTAPLRTLAVAAERLGRNVNSDPLPEDGPTEVATAAIAFNTMASRIRRFVTDRTLMLTAIGHDLRTPITRMKLRAEFIDDDELRAKFLADLDELEAMVSATLAFGRDSADREPMVPLDLNALLSTIIDDATDGRPDLADHVGFASPPPAVTLQARPLALKRALANLVGNGIKYGGGARVTLKPPHDGHVCVLIEDDGPGIPADMLERVFEPFVRMETSRNRETGGTGLGLSIARNIIRAQGGDIALANRTPHGLKATVTLVA
ncbi:ATP-binding protein [Acetobacteraceae bacterium KSS8]|uniref:histidine kinase n=1 Tax=Endosaccharibacter trunci TaxID=2812733 RepID=A0ABT1W9U3_9PROT|nr:ATP-binding protein [Acetobacteraceae bacterium KSS8]